MIANTFIDNAKVMSKGQVTIPKDVREILGISSGDRITFVVENGNVRQAVDGHLFLLIHVDPGVELACGE